MKARPNVTLPMSLENDALAELPLPFDTALGQRVAYAIVSPT